MPLRHDARVENPCSERLAPRDEPWQRRRGLYRTDEDRRRFLGLVGELPRQFGTEVHAFVRMENQDPLLVRCLRTGLCEALRWFPTTYAMRLN